MCKSIHEHKPMEPRLLALRDSLNATESFQSDLLAVTSASHCHPAISDRHRDPAALFCQKQAAYLAEKLPDEYS